MRVSRRGSIEANDDSFGASINDDWADDVFLHTWVDDAGAVAWLSVPLPGA